LKSFLKRCRPDSSILDVGCGNNSPYNIKSNFPGFTYTGIDIGDYNQTKPMLADHYVLTTPEKFSASIGGFKGQFDIVVSSHNLEHCDDRAGTLQAMLDAVKAGGVIYMAFPCEQSVGFPRRKQTLNYYDDPTHKDKPPSFALVLDTLTSNGFVVEFQASQYKPFALNFIGLLQEPFARRKNTILQGTWAYYGFEAIIWARKTKATYWREEGYKAICR
jgi:SAM-dependent methyltransferase